jgi:SAM-dependent methyltransferase
VTEIWDERLQAYRESASHREGPDLDRLVQWSGARPGVRALDVATGGGHVARRLSEAGALVISCDFAPGMKPDVVCRAEDLPFADRSFDVVVTRIAAHHFSDVAAAVAEMARVSSQLVLVEDTLYADETVEEAERLKDPTHVRSYTEDEWREFLGRAGLVVEDVEFVVKEHEFEPWLARCACTGEEADRVRTLLAPRIRDGVYRDTKILLRARKARTA